MQQKCEYEAQVIKEFGDHDRTGGWFNTAIMSADSRRPRHLRKSAFSPDTHSSGFDSCSNQLPPSRNPPNAPHFRMSPTNPFSTLGILLILLASLWIVPASAVLIEFTNCLSESYQNDTPIQLQFVPKFFDARFDTQNSTHSLNVTVFGNVTGQSGNNPVPDSTNTSYWSSNTSTNGKIQDEPDPTLKKLTTLFNKVNVLTYEPFSHSADFCDQVENGECPLGPVFNVTNT